MTGFVEKKRLVREGYEAEGLDCSARKSHRIARALDEMERRGVDFWSIADQPDLVRSPTEREALKNVMRQLAA